MESKKINQLATELAPSLSDLTIIGDPTTGISKKITLSQMASLFTGTVEEYPDVASFPLVGVADTIYIALDTNVLYRWNTGTSAYVELSPNIINSLVFSDANGFDGNISLVGSVATLTITTALTTGSVPFIGASGALSQDNANLFFDDTNNRLGINTNAPTTALDVFGSGIIGRLNGTSTNNSFLGFASAGTNKWSIGNVQSDHRFRIYSEANTAELVSVLQTGEFGIGIANPTTKLHIDGGATALIANLDANVSVAKSISFRSDNSNRINLEVSGTESGSNAGADLFIRTYTDAGALLNTPLTIVRSTGNATFVNNIAIANQTLSAWSATFGIMQSYYGSYFGGTSGGGTVMGNNNYFDGTNYKYVNTDFAGQIQIGSGNILFRVAASGTSGNNVTFTNALTIASTANIGIGTGTSTYASTRLLLRGADSASTNWGLIVEDGSTNQIFGVRNDGRVGVNTGTPNSVFNTVKDGTSTYNVATYAGSSFLSSRTTSSGENIAMRHTNGTQVGISGLTFAGQILSDGNNVLEIYTTSAGPLVLGTNKIERLRISGDGIVTITGGVGGSDFLRFLRTGTSHWGMGATGASLVIRDVTNNIEALSFTYGSGRLYAVPTYNNTYGSGANMYINSDGNLGRATSSLKYKTDVINYDKGLDIVKQLRPVYYKSKNETEKDRIFAGLIAEEVEELGLTEFVQYAEDGTPDALAYGNMIALAFKAIQELQAEIEILKAK